MTPIQELELQSTTLKNTLDTIVQTIKTKAMVPDENFLNVPDEYINYILTKVYSFLDDDRLLSPLRQDP
jgi:hypothetical protein